MEHCSTPDNYYTSNLWKDSPLSKNERETLRDEIRQLVLGIKEEVHLDEIEEPAIGEIELISYREESVLSVTVYLSTDNLETLPIGNEMYDTDGEYTTSEEVHYLRDLGDKWEALEYDIISELVLMLDLPETPTEISKYLLNGEEYGPCLYCNLRGLSHASFSITAHIPESTQQIYENAEFELARRLNIPIDGSTKQS
jgi:hypothetical protein